jgi:hypothetical protein
MAMAKHPHHDIIIALLEGETIQVKAEGHDVWSDVVQTVPFTLLNLFDAKREYRIKPVVKPNITKWVKLELKSVGTSRHEVKIGPLEHWEMANLELEFNGNTLQLVSANVLK